MPRLRPFLWVAGALVAGAVLLALVLYLGARGGPSAFAPPPEPNGYLVLVQAAAPLRPPPDGFRKLADDVLEPVVAGNRDALVQVRFALQQPGAVPVMFSESWFARAHSAEVMGLKQAARALQAEAEWHQRRGDTHAALLASLDGLRLSETTQRGGVLIDHLVGMAGETMAWMVLTNVTGHLTGADCRTASRALEEFESRREPFAAIQRREREWSRRSYGAFQRLGHVIRSRTLGVDPGTRQAESNAVARLQQRIRENNDLLLRLAARAHTLEKGAPPARAADLVPAYLQRVPVDPATGQSLELP